MPIGTFSSRNLSNRNFSNRQFGTRFFSSNSITSGGGGGGGTPSVSSTAWKNNAATTTVGVTVAPAATHALVVYIAANNGSNVNHACSDNIDGATGWNVIRGPDTTTVRSSLWYKFNVPAGITTITCNAGAGTANVTGIVHEVLNVSAFTGGESNSAAAGGSNNPQTGVATNATANSIYFAGLVEGATGVQGTFTINSTGTTGTWGYADATNSLDNTNTVMPCVSVVNLVVSSSAARGHGWAVTAFPSTECIVLVLH